MNALSETEVGAMVVGVTEMIKRFGMPSKYAPACAIVLSVLVSLLQSIESGISGLALITPLMRGVMIGVTSTGLYAATDKIANGAKVTPSDTI